MTVIDAGADAPDDDVIASPVGREVGPDEDDGPGDAEQIAATVGRRPRKPLNRALLAKAAAAVKSHLEGGDEDDDELAPTGQAAKPAAPAPTPDPAAAAAKPVERPAGPPPEAIAAWERANLKAAEIDKRETALKERESRARDVAGRFSADPFAALKDIVRADLGDEATEDEIADELAYQITAMSLGLSGATIDPQNQAHDLKKLKRELRQRKASERKAAAEAERTRTTEAKTTRERAVVTQIGEEFKPLAAKFPWLSTAEDPAGLLFDVIKRRHESTGELLELADAAKLADDYLGNADRSWYEKRKHLLTPTPTPTSPVVNAPQGDPLQRRSRALTNADASEDGAPPPDSPGPRLSVEERRRRTWEKHRDRLKTAERD